MQGVAVLVLVFMWCSQTVHAQGQWIANYIVATKVWGSGQSEGFKGWLTQEGIGTHAVTCTRTQMQCCTSTPAAVSV